MIQPTKWIREKFQICKIKYKTTQLTQVKNDEIVYSLRIELKILQTQRRESVKKYKQWRNDEENNIKKKGKFSIFPLLSW